MMNVIKSKLETLRWTFITIGVVMLILAVLTAWTDVLLRLLVALAILLIAYSLFAMAHKIHAIKKHLD